MSAFKLQIPTYTCNSEQQTLNYTEFHHQEMMQTSLQAILKTLMKTSSREQKRKGEKQCNVIPLLPSYALLSDL